MKTMKLQNNFLQKGISGPSTNKQKCHSQILISISKMFLPMAEIGSFINK